MIFHVYSLRDLKSEVFNKPFYSRTLQEAIRDLTREVQRDAPDNLLHSHPSDFQLFDLGTYDDQNGELTPPLNPVFVLGLNSLVPKG